MPFSSTVYFSFKPFVRDCGATLRVGGGGGGGGSLTSDSEWEG